MSRGKTSKCKYLMQKKVKNKVTDERAQLHMGMYLHLLKLDKSLNISSWKEPIIKSNSLHLTDLPKTKSYD